MAPFCWVIKGSFPRIRFQHIIWRNFFLLKKARKNKAALVHFITNTLYGQTYAGQYVGLENMRATNACMKVRREKRLKRRRGWWREIERMKEPTNDWMKKSTQHKKPKRKMWYVTVVLHTIHSEYICQNGIYSLGNSRCGNPCNWWCSFDEIILRDSHLRAHALTFARIVFQARYKLGISVHILYAISYLKIVPFRE